MLKCLRLDIQPRRTRNWRKSAVYWNLAEAGPSS